MSAQPDRQCGVCGATNRGDASRCQVCLSPLAESQGETPQTPQADRAEELSASCEDQGGAARQCQSCGMRIEDAAASFCSACGSRLPAEEAHPQVCPNPECGQALSEGAAFCSYCGHAAVAAPSAQAAAPTQASAPAEVPAPPQVCARPAPSWRRALGLFLAGLGLVLVLGAAIWGLRVFDKLPFGGGARPSPKTLADDDWEISAAMEEIRAREDAELDRRLEEILKHEGDDTAWPDEETAETDVSGAKEASP